VVADTGCLPDGKQPVGRRVRLRGQFVAFGILQETLNPLRPTHSPTAMTTLPQA